MGCDQKRSDGSAVSESYKDWDHNILFSQRVGHGSSQMACSHTCAEYKGTKSSNSPEDSAMDDVTIIEPREPERGSLSTKQGVPSYDDTVQHIIKTWANLTYFRRAVDTLTLSFLEAELQSKYLVPCRIYFQWICSLSEALITPDSSLGLKESLLSSENGQDLHPHPVKDLGHVLSMENLFQDAISYHTSLCEDLSVLHRLITLVNINQMKGTLNIKIRMYLDDLERVCKVDGPLGYASGKANTKGPCMIGCNDLRTVYDLVILILKRYKDSDVHYKSIEDSVLDLQRERRHFIDQLERLTKFSIYKTGQFLGSKMNSLLQEIYLQQTGLCQYNIQDCKIKLINLMFGQGYESLDLHSVQSVYMDSIMGGRP